MERWKEYVEDLTDTDVLDQENEAQEVSDWRAMESVREQDIKETLNRLGQDNITP